MELTEKGKSNRNAYYRTYRKMNKDKMRLITVRYWEGKASKYYGEYYEGTPDDPSVMSNQAREVRRMYNKKYHNSNKVAIEKKRADYWEGMEPK